MNKALLDKIDELQSVIDKHGTLDANIQNKINDRFRLDWNYYSNEMEGNSLTRMETRQLMIENVTVGNKPLKDVLEMSGHDKEVLEIMRVGKGDVRLSESRIKAMHRAIMYESDPEKKQHIGHWKLDRNYVINYKGEKFEFVAPDDVADAIHELLNTTNARIDAIKGKHKDAIHPVELAFQFHLEYVRIHPFYDGNGRTARLLTNLLLISLGFPPVILRKKERELYYKYLADIQGYDANPDLFLGLMSDLVINSQQLVLDAIAGKDIEEEDDLDKEIALWKVNLKNTDVVDNSEIIGIKKELFKNSFTKLFDLFIKKHQPFYDLFLSSQIRVSIGARHENSQIDRIVKQDNFSVIKNAAEFPNQEIWSEIENRINESTKWISITTMFKGFKESTNHFDQTALLQLTFEDSNYSIHSRHKLGDPLQEIEKEYTKGLTDGEIQSYVKDSVRQTLEGIKKAMNS